MRKTIILLICFSVCLSGLLLWGMSAPASITAQEDFTPTPTQHTHTNADGEVPHVSPQVIEIGYSLYLENGCNACHGENGEGTDLAPALAGHTRDDVYRQLRAPTGIMTPFSPEQIGIRDAEYIVAYIENLPMSDDMNMGSGHTHMHGTFRLSHVVVYHHWYALWALQEENKGEAIHHVSHIIEFTEGPHQVAMQTILEQIVNDEFAEAQASIENMLFGMLPPETSQAEDYIRIGLVMLQLEKPFHATHYLEHSQEMLPLDSPLQNRLDEIIFSIEEEDFVGAQDQLTALIAELMPMDMSGMDNMDNMNDGSMHTHTGLASMMDLTMALEASGATTSLDETLDQPFFDVPAQVVMINETQALQVFEFADEMSAMDAMNSVDSSGSPIGTSQVSWMMPPHFYHSGHLIVIYSGMDESTLTLLNEVVGEQFAGQ